MYISTFGDAHGYLPPQNCSSDFPDESMRGLPRVDTRIGGF